MTQVTHICQTDSRYPGRLVYYLGADAPSKLSAVGNLELLKAPPLALFCSRRCPGNLILQMYDLAQKLRQGGTPVIGGFHSPVERECLTILLRGKNPITICLPRSFERMRIPKEYYKPIDNGRLLLLSQFSTKKHRADKTSTVQRNVVVGALAAQVFVAHAEPGSKTELLSRIVVNWGKPLYVLEGKSNSHLCEIGAKPTSSDLFLTDLL